ncbi:MAG: phosphohistidine phosphatase SixA [Desulfobulbaceae bacterium]|nr:MAG: phosphohistidine phosphatase SixA [Desulfobulbaceae bacterium]
MSLYLVQHGLSLGKDEDPEKGLSETGIATTKRIAEVAAGYNVRVQAIHHSAKKRARQTAELLAAALHPPAGTAEQSGLLPLDDVSRLAPQLASADQLMLVGHLPFMERLTGLLVSGDPQQLICKFQNSGIICLDQEPDRATWFIKWTLMPNIG